MGKTFVLYNIATLHCDKPGTENAMLLQAEETEPESMLGWSTGWQPLAFF
jgi:hypothetical protein